jgi:AraC-like DNA-binding protein
MLTTELRKEKILEIKKKLMSYYVCLICTIFILYSFVFAFYMIDYTMVYYLMGGTVGLCFLWFALKNRYSIDTLVRLYFIVAPLYNFFVMLKFWNLSVASFVWLVPLPLGAYIFLSAKEVFLYTFYSIITIVIGVILASTIEFNFIQHTREQVRATDIFLFASNISVVTLLVYYKDKIRRLEILTEIEEKEKIILPVTLDNKNSEMAESIFQQIEQKMTEESLFKDENFNISVLSTILMVNNNYISKAIRSKGFSNFNSYINSLRIKYVKQLMNEKDLEKVTLMYIYTEAGFTSQSTFNRAFKQEEGVTPSEYLQSLKIPIESNS